MNTCIQIREMVIMTFYWAASTNTCEEREIHEKAQVEQQVLNVISLLVNENDIINALIDELNSDNNNANGIHIVNIKMFKKQLGKAYDKRKKLDNDYFEGNIESSTYNRLMNELQLEINKLKRNIRESEREIIKNDSIINKEEVIHVLTNFNKLFKIVNDEEKKLLIRSLIREVRMEANRKDIKEITFWFLPDSILPSNKVRRTLP